MEKLQNLQEALAEIEERNHGLYSRRNFYMNPKNTPREITGSLGRMVKAIFWRVSDGTSYGVPGKLVHCRQTSRESYRRNS